MRLEDSIIINCPPEEVWIFVTDWFNAPRVSAGGELGLRQTSPGPMGIGSTLQGRRMILGFEMRIKYLVTEWDPPHALSSTISGGPLRSGSSRTTLEAVGDGTRLSGWLELEARPAWKVLLPIIGPALRRNRRKSWASLKRVVESTPRQTEPPA